MKAKKAKDEDIFQLSLTFKFQPTVALRQLGAGNRWCHSLEEVEEFRSFIDSSPAIIAVGQATPSRCNVFLRQTGIARMFFSPAPRRRKDTAYLRRREQSFSAHLPAAYQL